MAYTASADTTTSALLDLAPELRNEIYELVLVDLMALPYLTMVRREAEGIYFHMNHFTATAGSDRYGFLQWAACLTRQQRIVVGHLSVQIQPSAALKQIHEDYVTVWRMRPRPHELDAMGRVVSQATAEESAKDMAWQIALLAFDFKASSLRLEDPTQSTITPITNADVFTKDNFVAKMMEIFVLISMRDTRRVLRDFPQHMTAQKLRALGKVLEEAGRAAGGIKAFFEHTELGIVLRGGGTEHV